jgi:hypothetical protein
MNMNTKNDKARFDPARELTMDDIVEPYEFIMKKEVGSGFMQVLYGHDVKNFKTVKEAQDTLFNKIQELRKSEKIDNIKNEIIVISARNKFQMTLKGMLPQEVDEWAKKLGVPEE